MNFSEMIKESRAKVGWSYRKLASETGISHSHIRDIENRKYTPSFENAVKIATTLDIDLTKVIISTYKAQLRNLLFELIETCDQYEVEVPYEDWVQSNLPIQPLNSDKTKLHDEAFRISKTLYTEANEQRLNNKLKLVEAISESKYQSNVYSEIPDLLELINTTTQIHGIPTAAEKVSAFKHDLDELNQNVINPRGDNNGKD